MDCERIREHLEAYALDALELAERAEVERHLSTCAECRAEADALAEVVSLFPEALAVASPRSPADDVKERVLKTVAAHSAPLQQQSSGMRSEGFKPHSLIPTGTSRGSRSLLELIVHAVPVVLLILSLLWGIRLTVALDQERDLNAEYLSLLGEVTEQQEPVFEVIGFDDTNLQFLSAQQADSTSYGKLFTRPSMPYVVVMAGRLPTATGGATFHVWVTSNGQPTLVGELKVDEHGFGLLVYTADQPGPKYETAFVTLQSPGGASPEGTEVLRHDGSGSS